MTNFALEKRLGEMGIPFARAKVGDRYVLEMLVERGWECGGENSGHLLCLDCHSDGRRHHLVAAGARGASWPSGQIARASSRASSCLLPQVLVNVKLAGKLDLQAPAVKAGHRARRPTSPGAGACLLRPSGTEPVVRVMVEGEDRAHVQELAETIAAAVQPRLVVARTQADSGRPPSGPCLAG